LNRLQWLVTAGVEFQGMWNELLVAFAIFSLCVVIHVGGIMTLADLLTNRAKPHRVNSLFLDMEMLLLSFAVIIVLHLSETTIWAVYYYLQGLFPDFETSLYFSFTCYTTMGFGDVVLPQKWRILGGVEGFSGVLLSGLSTAFLFVVLSTLRSRRDEPKSG
jgi:voltage-gated potassium channel